MLRDIKRKTTFGAAAAVMLLSLFSNVAHAITYEEIMAKIREAREAEAALNDQREAEFQDKLEEQQRLVSEVDDHRVEAGESRARVHLVRRADAGEQFPWLAPDSFHACQARAEVDAHLRRALVRLREQLVQLLEEFADEGRPNR